MTDGVQTDMPGAIEPAIIAAKIRNAGINLVVIGTGSKMNAGELSKIAGKDSWYTKDNWQSLMSSKFTKLAKSCDKRK